MPQDDEVQELCIVAQQCTARGWCAATGGNFSVVTSRSPLRLAMSASGVAKDDLRPETLLEVDERGTAVVETTSARPSAEAELHAAVAAATGCGCVLHVHSVANTLLGEHFVDSGSILVSGYEILKAFPGVSSHLDTVNIPVVANSQNMAVLAEAFRYTYDAFPNMPALLVAGHGVYTWGPSVLAAHRRLEALEFLFEVLLRRVQLSAFP